MVLGNKKLMINKTLLGSVILMTAACSATEMNKAGENKITDWTNLIDNCQISINDKLVNLPLIAPCTHAVNEDGSPRVVEIEGRNIAIVIGHTTDFKYLKSVWEYVKEGDGCSQHSVGVNLDDKGTPIEISKPAGGGILCPRYAIDIKWFWSYEWPKKLKS